MKCENFVSILSSDDVREPVIYYIAYRVVVVMLHSCLVLAPSRPYIIYTLLYTVEFITTVDPCVNTDTPALRP